MRPCKRDGGIWDGLSVVSHVFGRSAIEVHGPASSLCILSRLQALSSGPESSGAAALCGIAGPGGRDLLGFFAGTLADVEGEMQERIAHLGLPKRCAEQRRCERGRHWCGQWARFGLSLRSRTSPDSHRRPHRQRRPGPTRHARDHARDAARVWTQCRTPS